MTECRADIANRPDGSTIITAIKGISFNLNRDILVDSNLTKEDVPIGSEVWLNAIP